MLTLTLYCYNERKFNQMDLGVRKRRDAIINVAFAAMILALIYVFFKYIFSVAAPFLIGFFIAIILQRPLRWLDKKTKKKCHGLWSILLVVLCLVVLLGPVVTILALIGKEISNFISYLATQLSDLPSFLSSLQEDILGIIKFLPENIYTSASDRINESFSRIINNFDLSMLNIDMKSITSGLSSGLSGIYGVVKNIPATLIAIVIAVIATIFFTKDYNFVVNFIKLQLPESNKNILSEIKQIFSKTVLKMFKAYALIMFITFCELLLGFTILNLIGVMDNSYIAIIAAAIAIFDILPVAGSGGILVPWAVIALVLGNTGQAIGLLAMYVIIFVIRQYLEPKIVGTNLGVHPLVTLAGLYLGAKLFGVLGIFIVPISVVTLKAFNDAGRIHLYNTPKRN